MIPGIVASGQMSRRRASAGPSYGWKPTDLAGLLFWLRSDAGVTLGGVGHETYVTALADQSGNGLDTVQEDDGGGDRVIVQNNATAGFNEILFAAGGAGHARLRFTATSPFSGVTSAHIFASLKAAADPAASQPETGLWHFSPEGATSGSLYPWTDGNIYDGFGTNTRYNFDPTPSLAAWRYIDVLCQSGTDGYKFFIDGAEQISQTGDGSQWNSSCWFGRAKSDGPTNTFAGAFLDLFMYDHVLTGTDLANARLYVADRISGAWTAAGGDG